ncbi:DUF6221 family protein [Streptomyces hydrogenans]|uniref:DUF6221 family protein n=1 Tax=Streptomyces hydrogenans TaxID=1873719 RepID=UPI003699CBA8
MDDLLKFLAARLREDEEVALAAAWDADASRRWAAEPLSRRRWGLIDDTGSGVVVVDPANTDAAGVARHMERQDPAQVLRAVAAQRRIVEYVEEQLDAGPDAKLTHVLQVLALAHGGHPDYQAGWRP